MRPRDRVVDAVLLVTALAVVARLIGLGARPFHWEEARVGYWTLRFLETGVYEYRPVGGGPFLYVVNRWLFALLTPTDAVARLVVAVAGGLLPLAALIFRRHTDGRTPDNLTPDDRTPDDGTPGGRTPDGRASGVGLDDAETVLLAVLLGFAPPLLYYSRFLRGDALLATFGVAAIGLLHRARADADRRALYGAAAAFGLAVATSGLVVTYVAGWLLAAALTFDEVRVRGESGAVALAQLRRAVDRLQAWATPIARATFLFLGVVLAFYLPRGVVDLSRPGTVYVAVERAFVGSARKFVGVRVLDRRFHGHSLLPYLGDHVETLTATALVLVVLAVAGFLSERYTPGSRPLVSFCTYWGGASLLIVPAVAEVSAPWLVVHTVAPLAVPAAVAGGKFARYARGVASRRDAARTAAVALLLVAAGIHVGATLSDDVYGPPERSDDLAQYAQPTTDLDPMLDAVATAIAGNDGTDVLYVGSDLHVADESTLDRPPVPEAAREPFSNRLPLPWYFERLDAETASVDSVQAMPDDAPPVVVADASLEERLEDRLPDYRVFEVDLGLFDRTVVIFVEQ